MDDSTQAILVCMRMRDVEMPARGSQIGICSFCQAPVWLAPTSLKVLHTVTVLCPACAEASAQPDDEFGGMIEGQVEEIERELQRPTEN